LISRSCVLERSARKRSVALEITLNMMISSGGDESY
jgi:hypothetical protein